MSSALASITTTETVQFTAAEQRLCAGSTGSFVVTAELGTTSALCWYSGFSQSRLPTRSPIGPYGYL